MSECHFLRVSHIGIYRYTYSIFTTPYHGLLLLHKSSFQGSKAFSYTYTYISVVSQDGSCRFKEADVGATEKGCMDIKEGSEDDLQAAVASVGPISVAIDAGHASFQLYR